MSVAKCMNYGGPRVDVAPRDLTGEAVGWSAFAPELATFLLDRLPNRYDVWGAYIPELARAADQPNVWTAPAKTRRGVEHLSAQHIVQHFTARHAGDVIGLHTTSPENTSRWFGLDFDVHDECGNAIDMQREAVAAAFSWCIDALGERISLLLEDSNGNGGRHLWGYFESPVATPALFVYLSATAGECFEATGFRPETYPKQPRLALTRTGTQQVGNWLRLPGRHHTKAHWSRLAWPGGEWQSGAEAARMLFDWPASDPTAIPPLDAYAAIETPPPARQQQFPKLLAGGARADRIARYVEKLPHGVAGSGRSNHLFRLAAFLCHDAQCTSVEALAILHAWNGGNAPPLPEWKVTQTWKNAGQYGGRRAA
ncbi:MAG TPA: hypothetical protein VGE27_17805 [Gemmatimonas sp.]|uniref:TOTE conflict system archaeo-eukaryotic primase domain-containing protein n=1 Tax=Gemmatimonas sp. TaxID=1962908 RepID=UPI002ED9DE1E